MKRFSEAYLNEVMETQGELFEDVKDYIPGIDVADFITKYMNSKTRALIDEGQAYLCTMEAKELFEYFVRTDSYQTKYGKDIGGFIPNWIGQFYACFQWVYNMSSGEVVKKVPLDFIIVGYRGLHDLDLLMSVKKVGRQLQLLPAHEGRE